MSKIDNTLSICLLADGSAPLTILNEASLPGVAVAHQSILPNQSMRIPIDPASLRSSVVILHMRVPNVKVTHPCRFKREQKKLALNQILDLNKKKLALNREKKTLASH